ncbi:hypothetical protein PP47_gp14 [Pectobacterium phage PP47]|uniref:Uncharacterized protein n=2 Tax=Pektosvirus TaxID=2732689 RepID=A0A1L7DRY5_9CAUD|nr:hypothetical protein HOR48_gp14 [Pectobacterium phage PP81]YP_009788711.1 hypothetical protein HOR52_gp14 [Pectobacterium phage PP47]APU03037.1 hypothetical protein PP81_gp14 [Pectobacterium phage PP81]AYM47368.1 hypothetical protein PP47_gp14 [Pectobacterium phage PP47]
MTKLGAILIVILFWAMVAGGIALGIYKGVLWTMAMIAILLMIAIIVAGSITIYSIARDYKSCFPFLK